MPDVKISSPQVTQWPARATVYHEVTYDALEAVGRTCGRVQVVPLCMERNGLSILPQRGWGDDSDRGKGEEGVRPAHPKG